ncbi:AcrR family transcriptional regulator [Catenulispora sp. EB89]|uniref:TetR/AcrR family transcriptional regulator n=1 Tax=Catenulispora sp. EB89 TaxID=3156257 RepID=UPI003518BA49
MAEEEISPRQRAAETKRRRTREAIIMATLDLYDGLDHGDFTRDQVAEAADVGTATVHNHFNTKFEMLRAAHERLLAPIIQPIVRGHEDGTYHPTDGVHELIRYVYSIAKMSHEYRALTVAMIRAYFETPPENREELSTSDGIYQRRRDRLLAGHITDGLHPITMQPPFVPPESEGVAFAFTFLSDKHLLGPGTLNYHATALLMELYHQPLSPGSSDEQTDERLTGITSTVCGELLPVLLPGEARKSMLEQVREIAPKVEEQFEQWKRRKEMQGWQ